MKCFRETLVSSKRHRIGRPQIFYLHCNHWGKTIKPTRGETNYKLALTRPTRPPAKRVLRFWLTVKDVSRANVPQHTPHHYYHD